MSQDQQPKPGIDIMADLRKMLNQPVAPSKVYVTAKQARAYESFGQGKLPDYFVVLEEPVTDFGRLLDEALSKAKRP